MLTLASVTGAAALAVWSPLLDVDRVVVVGAGPRSAQVRETAGVEHGAALLLLDTGAVEARVESLAWVHDARAERDLPGTLRITVHERPPAAFAPRPDGGVALVDATGIVTGDAATAPGALPALVTTHAPPRPGGRVEPAAAARVAGALGPLAPRVARVSVEGARAALLLTDGIEVRLGDLQHVDEKARAAAAVLSAASGRGITYVDVRVPGAPVTG